MENYRGHSLPTCELGRWLWVMGTTTGVSPEHRDRGWGWRGSQ